MAITISIALSENTARDITIDPEEFTLGLLEDLEKAQETGKWRDLAPVIAGMLGLTRDEQRAINLRQWRQLGQAMREAAEVPNASG